MTLPRYAALRRHWDRYPPVEIWIAAAMEARAKGRATASLDRLFEIFGPDGRLRA